MYLRAVYDTHSYVASEFIVCCSVCCSMPYNHFVYIILGSFPCVSLETGINSVINNGSSPVWDT